MMKAHKMTWAVLGLLGLMISLVAAEDEFKPSIDFKGSRMAIGYLDSGKDGSYKYGSYQMPDAKLRFNWQMDKNITIVTRMGLKNATFDSLDYFYMEYRNLFPQFIESLKDSTILNPTLRMGRIKVDIGEETFADNPVESVVASNSAGIVAGYDEGLQLLSSLPKETLGVPFKWSLSFFNGNTATGADNNQAKAMCLKLGANPLPELYVSASYYDSGEMGGKPAVADAEVTYAGAKTSPTGAKTWSRTIQEIDVRYDFQPGKENRLNPGAPAFSDSKAFVRFAYGQFTDNGSCPGVKVTNVAGSYYYLEGCYNATEKIYLAARDSFIGFNKSTLYAPLNSVNVNDYTRLSLGVGFRLTSNSQFKIENAANTEKMPKGVKAPENNQIALLFTTKF
jgi:hypothetical protein